MNVNKNNINSVLSGPKLIALFFHNPTCGPCKSAKVSLDMAAKLHGITIGAVNTHADEEVPKRYGVRSTPMIVFVKNNREVGRIGGSPSPAQLSAIIKGHV
jgi:thiol-disulfide isomerase/thioredoxin